MEKVSIVGLDIAKNSFHAHGASEDGSKVFSKALPRGRVLELFGQIEPCTVAMEACAGAHHWSRELSKLSHDVRLIAPQYVKPYVKRQKNDANDAEAIAEAASRPTMYYQTGDACIAERAICGDQECRATRTVDGTQDPRFVNQATYPDDQCVTRAVDGTTRLEAPTGHWRHVGDSGSAKARRRAGGVVARPQVGAQTQDAGCGRTGEHPSHTCCACVAGQRMARMAWAIMAHDGVYETLANA